MQHVPYAMAPSHTARQRHKSTYRGKDEDKHGANNTRGQDAPQSRLLHCAMGCCSCTKGEDSGPIAKHSKSACVSYHFQSSASPRKETRRSPATRREHGQVLGEHATRQKQNTKKKNARNRRSDPDSRSSVVLRLGFKACQYLVVGTDRTSFERRCI